MTYILHNTLMVWEAPIIKHINIARKVPPPLWGPEISVAHFQNSEATQIFADELIRLIAPNIYWTFTWTTDSLNTSHVLTNNLCKDPILLQIIYRSDEKMDTERVYKNKNVLWVSAIHAFEKDISGIYFQKTLTNQYKNDQRIWTLRGLITCLISEPSPKLTV